MVFCLAISACLFFLSFLTVAFHTTYDHGTYKSTSTGSFPQMDAPQSQKIDAPSRGFERLFLVDDDDDDETGNNFPETEVDVQKQLLAIHVCVRDLMSKVKANRNDKALLAENNKTICAFQAQLDALQAENNGLKAEGNTLKAQLEGVEASMAALYFCF